MSQFQFSLSSLHKFQDQRKRMAEIDVLQCQSGLNETLQKIQELNLQLQEANQSFQFEKAGPGALQNQRLVLKQIAEQISEASGLADQQRELLGKAKQRLLDETVKVQAYDVLHDRELAKFRQTEQKERLNEMMDNYLSNQPSTNRR